MQTPFEFLTLERAEDVATITLNRPPLNILTIAMIRELIAALDSLAGQENLKAVVLAASGKAFCAGVDVADHTPERVEPMIREFGRLFVRLRTFPAPTIAVVHGAALGGGTELAAACDQVLAGESARFGQPEIKLGVFPPIAAALFPRLIGYQQAARLVLTGETISAQEAAALGLVTAVAPDGELAARAEHLLTQLRGLSAAVLRLAKRALLLGTDLGTAQALSPIEDLYLQELMTTTDVQEGLQAFIEKRVPVWSNR